MKRKPRILYVVEAFGGGIFTYLVELANGLCDDYDIYIAYGLRKQTPDHFKKYFNKKIKFVQVKNFRRSISPKYDLLAFLELRKIYKKIKPDIVHLNSSKAGVLGRLAFSGKEAPIFYTPHGYSFLMKSQAKSKRKLFWLAEKACAFKKNTITLSCSLGEHKETLKLTKKAQYINNGIDINSLQSLINKNKELIRKHNFSIYTVGRISYQKNPTLFNQIALSLPNVRFIWIGDGELRNELTSPNIKITGWLKRDDALTIAMDSDVFILTSLWEGLPMSLLEAMYMRKICIVSDVIGNHDVIKNELNGYVCNTKESFTTIINKVREKDLLKIRTNAYQDVVKNYNTKIMIQKYNKIYNESLLKK